MTYGVTIDSTNTKTQWGLILLNDLVIGAPPMREVLIEIPGRSGTINASYAVSDGDPVFGDRIISFTLFKAVNDADLATLRSTLMTNYHGKVCTIKLPTDTTHYYRGIVHIGDISGYNSGKIPVSITAEPYRYANTGNTPSL